MDKNEFSTRLTEVMEMSGYSMKDFAQKCEIPYSTIRGYLVGESLPAGIEQIQKISKATGVSVAWLVGEDNENSTKTDHSKQEFELLVSLVEHLSEVQRGIILKQVLTFLMKQTDRQGRSDSNLYEKLTPAVINMAFELQAVSEEKQQAIREEYRLGKK